MVTQGYKLVVDTSFSFFLLLLTSFDTFEKIGPSGVRALPLAAGINEGGHYFRYFFFFLLFFLVVLTTAIQKHRRGCHRVSHFCMGSEEKNKI